jgi:hypothetical protein
MDKPLHLDNVEKRVFRYLLRRYQAGDVTVDYTNMKIDNRLTHPQCEAIIALFYELGILSKHDCVPFHVIEKRIVLLDREVNAPISFKHAITGDFLVTRKCATIVFVVSAACLAVGTVALMVTGVVTAWKALTGGAQKEQTQKEDKRPSLMLQPSRSGTPCLTAVLRRGTMSSCRGGLRGQAHRSQDHETLFSST